MRCEVAGAVLADNASLRTELHAVAALADAKRHTIHVMGHTGSSLRKQPLPLLC